MLNEISQSQQDRYCIIPLIRGAETIPSHRVQKQRVVARGSGEG